MKLIDINYRYPNAANKVLHGISLAIEAGENVAITGPPSSGKSTLISLLSGLHLGYEGSLIVNGVPLRELSIMSYRGMVGDNLSIQDLFSGTLAENISLGRDIPTKTLLETLHLVGLGHYLKQSQQGLSTIIKPEGLGLSSSEKTKIILARIIAQRPKLVLLDQVLDQLTSDDKVRITNVLLDPRFDWTTVMITNDKEIHDQVDRVLTLENGRIVDNQMKSSMDKKI